MRYKAPSIGFAFWVLALRWTGAQVARGLVRDSAAAVALPGTVVIVLDSASLSMMRTITDSSGRFSVAHSALGRADRLRILHIGYRPREVRMERADTDSINISLVRIPTLLSEVRVAERAICPDRSDANTTGAWQLWDQARAGLLATVVAGAANPVTATTLVYQRRTAPYDGLIRRQSVDVRAGSAARPFSALEPIRLAEHGYLDEDSTGRTFHGLDADVLLDPSFVSTHCFGVVTADAPPTNTPSRRRARRIGVAFSPTPDRDTVVDVRGVVWFDTDSIKVALSELEFQYTALEPAAMRAAVGGQIGFRTLANGVTFVERWTLRLPVLTANAGAEPNNLASVGPGRTRRMADRRARVTEIEEAGGVVTEAKWKDGTAWRAALTGLTGTVLESGAQSPVPGALVRVAGGPSTVANRYGEFMIAPLLPGRYTIEIADTTLNAFADMRRTTQEIEVGRDQLVRMTTRVASATGAVAEACKSRRAAVGAVGAATDMRLVAGRLLVSGAEVPITLRSARIRASVPSADSVRVGASSAVSIDDLGAFTVCAPSTATDMTLRLSADRFEADTTIDIGLSAVTPLDWRPTLRLATSGPTTRIVRGMVTDTAQRPIARVNVTASGLGATTDASGAFQLRLATHERAVIELRRLGFAPARYVLSAGKDTAIALTLLPRVQQLEALEVKAAAPVSANLRGFEERLQRNTRGITFGTFITADQIERRNPAQVTQLFFDIPYIKVIKVHPQFERYSLFGLSRNIEQQQKPCPAVVFIDGIRVLEGGDDLGTKDPVTGRPVKEDGVAVNDLVSPAQIAGIEVYRNGFDAPPQFQSTNGSCVVVLIWTK